MRRIATAMLLTLVGLVLGATAASAQSALANCKYYTKVLQDFASGLPYCEACLKEEPDNPEARFYAGWCLAEVGKFSEAHEAFAPLLGKANDPDKNVREHAKMAEARVNQYAGQHFNAGSELLGKGDMKAAHDEFQKRRRSIRAWRFPKSVLDTRRSNSVTSMARLPRIAKPLPSSRAIPMRTSTCPLR
jgi:tetratricopeptide (TPR) repeat protein